MIDLKKKFNKIKSDFKVYMHYFIKGSAGEYQKGVYGWTEFNPGYIIIFFLIKSVHTFWCFAITYGQDIDLIKKFLINLNPILKLYIIYLQKSNIYLFDSQMKILYIIQCGHLSLMELAARLARVERLQRLFYEIFAFVNQIEKY